MPKPRVSAAGGLAALTYTWKKGRDAGGAWKLYKRMRSKNACKTCAYGMGGQRGGMVNEQGAFPEVCKKSLQAQAGDMQAALTEAFFQNHPISELESWSSLQLEAAGRLAFPIEWREGATHFRAVGWDAAHDAVAAALRDAAPEQTFFYSSGRSSNEAAFLMQLFARAYGTANIHNCSYYCHQASGVALGRMFGTGTSTLVLDDLDKADLAVVAGANPASNHPRLIGKLVDIRARGGLVIVINPVRELGLCRFRIPSRPGSLLFGSEVSDIYLQPHVGADIACFKALLKGLVERDAVDRAYVAAHVDGWAEVEADVRATDWTTLLDACGLARVDVDRAVAGLATARRGVMLWAMGLTHHEHGVQNVVALANLALARGWVGREGCGLLPIRGHSNVQGVGSVGFSPALKEAFATKLADAYWHRSRLRHQGLDTYRCMEAAHHGRMRVAVQLGGNLFGSNPDRSWAAQSLKAAIETTFSISTKLNEGHIHGRGRHHIIVPVLARDEERQPTTQESMFNYVRQSDGGEEPPSPSLKSEVEVICAIATRVLGRRPLLPEGGRRVDPAVAAMFASLGDHDALRQAMAAVVPGYDAMATIGETKHEFQIAGRTFHTPTFHTATGRAHAAVTPLPAFRPEAGQFRLMTLRSEGQFNTVVYEQEDLYRGTSRRDVVMMAAPDGQRHWTR